MKVYEFSLDDLYQAYKNKDIIISSTSDIHSYIYSVRFKNVLDTDFSFRHYKKLGVRALLKVYATEVLLFDKLNGVDVNKVLI